MNINNLLGLLKMDSHTFQQMRYRSLSLITGVLIVGTIPFLFDEILQGYYFTFASLLSVQILFELGLNAVVVQMIAHEYGKLSVANNSLRETKNGNLARLSKILEFFKKWYLIASVLMFFGLLSLGIFLFNGKEEVEFKLWFYPWLILSLVTSINLYLNVFSSALEGFGKVNHVAEKRFWGTLFGIVLFTIMIIIERNLFVMSAITICQIIAILVLIKNDKTLKEINSNKLDKIEFSWKKEVFPFQWRIAVSWMAGYFSLYLFTPVTFNIFGPVEAGKIGLTFAIFNAVFSISSTWVTSQFPKFGHLISIKETKSLNKNFIISSLKSQATVSIGIFFGIIIFIFLNNIEHYLMLRLPSFYQFSLIASVTFINTYILSLTTFMRAHKEEPMLNASIVQALLMIFILWNAVYGLNFLLLSYNIINLFIAIWATIKLKKYYHS